MKPILKWAGGKKSLLKYLTLNLPKKFNRYFEPFIGGGALFFDLGEKFSYISDVNPELINFYCVLRDSPKQLLDKFNEFCDQDSEQFFMSIRNWDRDGIILQKTVIERAARFLYINKFGFNGLYRENSKGQVNTGYGNKNKNFNRKTEVKNITLEYLFEYSKILKTTNIDCNDYRNIVNHVKSGDFVYIDPPYLPVTEGSHTKYNSKVFSIKDWEELSNICIELDKKGVYFMVSSSDNDSIREFFCSFNIITIMAPRRLGQKKESRKKTSEIIIKNY